MKVIVLGHIHVHEGILNPHCRIRGPLACFNINGFKPSREWVLHHLIGKTPWVCCSSDRSCSVSDVWCCYMLIMCIVMCLPIFGHSSQLPLLSSRWLFMGSVGRTYRRPWYRVRPIPWVVTILKQDWCLAGTVYFLWSVITLTGWPHLSSRRVV